MPNETQLAVVFQVKNEARQIRPAVESAKQLTDNIVVMDMESTDQTALVAKSAGAMVIKIPSAPYVELVRPLAFSQTRSEWVLILDADERLTPEIVQEIKTVVAQRADFTHYNLPRKNIFGGKAWFKHGGWWPDRQIRLIKCSAFREWPANIHSTVKVSGKIGILKHPFLHYFHGDLETMVAKTIKFEQEEAILLYQAGRAVKTATFGRKFLGELFRRLIKYQGWRDGAYGVIESFYQAYSKTITWLFLYEKKHI